MFRRTFLKTTVVATLSKALPSIGFSDGEWTVIHNIHPISGMLNDDGTPPTEHQYLIGRILPDGILLYGNNLCTGPNWKAGPVVFQKVPIAIAIKRLEQLSPPHNKRIMNILFEGTKYHSFRQCIQHLKRNSIPYKFE